jgi:hypothetical protein
VARNDLEIYWMECGILGPKILDEVCHVKTSARMDLSSSVDMYSVPYSDLTADS